MASYDSLKDYIRLNKMDVISEGLKEFIKTNQKEVVGYNIKNIVIRTLSCQPQEWIMKSSDVNNDLFFTIGISAVIKNSNVPIGSLHYYNIDLKGNAFDDLSDLSLFHITEVDSEDSLQKETFLSLFGLPEITNECFEDKAEELYKKILSLIKHLGVKDEYKYQFPIDIIETKLKIDEYFADLPEKCVAKILMESSKEKIYLPVLPLTSECLTNLPKGSILLSKNNLFNYNYFPDRIVTVAHELIHWVLHQSFYKIMKILGSDNRLFKYVDKFETFNDSMSSQDKAFWYAENQAEELSYRLSMPKHLMESAIIECIESESKYQTAADFNENIVKTLAGMFEVSYLTMKKRLIQLGYDFVNGTLVNVDGEDYPPFTFPIGILSNKSSYIINKGSYQKLQCDNKEFSDIIESKEYVYTGCVVCFYDKKYVYRNDKNDKIELTDYARDHIEECCILFNDEGKYLIDVHVPIDSPKSFNRNFGYIKAKPVSFDLDTEGTDLDDATIKQIEEYNNTLNVLHKEEHKLFANTLIYHMNTKGKAGEPIDDKELAKRTHLSTTAIANICIGKTNKPNIKNVMALCIALSLDPEECYDMFQKAGYDIWEDTPRNRAYRYLCTCTMSGLTEANKILRVFRQEEVPDHKGQLS